jgi:hypothetical protein
MSEVLEVHSVAFWMHLYRRLAPRLASIHDGKRDAHTVALVRQHAELAISKFGSLSRTDDLREVGSLRPRDILGGHYQRLWSRWLKGQPVAFRMRVEALIATNQWVMADFEPRDLRNIFLVEGLAYEYWRVTAKMRAVGKGEKYSLDGDWLSQEISRKLVELIQIYDQRIDHLPLSVSLAGGWLNPVLEKTSATSGAFVPFYNVEHEHKTVDAFLKSFGVRTPKDRTLDTNFVIDGFDLIKFYQAHSFLESAFEARRGYSLKAYVACLWALSNMVFFPARALFFNRQSNTPRNIDDPLAINAINILQRGYGVWNGPISQIIDEIATRLKLFSFALEGVRNSEIAKCVDSFTLQEAEQKKVGVWSGGPRFPIIPYDNSFVVDLQGVPQLLVSSFVGIRDVRGAKGTVFEEGFREALKGSGLALEKFGEIENSRGERREIDASVRIGDDLVLLECKSMERPLDIEIGKPQSLARREAELNAKIDQALSLAEFIVKDPKGKNYDFTWAKRVASFVVSPFIEWIWDTTPRLWYTRGVSRILSADEAISYLKQWKETGIIPLSTERSDTRASTSS